MHPLFFQEQPFTYATQILRQTKAAQQLQVEIAGTSPMSLGAAPIAVCIGNFARARQILKLNHVTICWSIAEQRGGQLGWTETTFLNEIRNSETYNGLLGFIVPGEVKGTFIETSQEPPKQKSSRFSYMNQDRTLEEYKASAMKAPTFGWVPQRDKQKLLQSRLKTIYNAVTSAPEAHINLDFDPFALIIGGRTTTTSNISKAEYPRSIHLPLDPELTRELVQPVRNTDHFAAIRQRWTYTGGYASYLRIPIAKLPQAFTGTFDREILNDEMIHNLRLSAADQHRTVRDWLSSLFNHQVYGAVMDLGPGMVAAKGIANFDTPSDRIEIVNIEPDQLEPNYAFEI
jgi:hypothetical protein